MNLAGFHHITHVIEKELEKPLPGKDIQLKMSSIRRIRELNNIPNTIHSIKSSVLILLYPGSGQNEISTVLIQRPSYDGVHGGQISLPGGRFEASDKDLRYTALRETKEEIGIDPDKVITIGVLTELYIPPSNFLVSPYVGYMFDKPAFNPDPQEVAGIIEINLSDLTNDENLKEKEIYLRQGISVFAPCFEIKGYIIWGATAMILNEFREILKRIEM